MEEDCQPCRFLVSSVALANGLQSGFLPIFPCSSSSPTAVFIKLKSGVLSLYLKHHLFCFPAKRHASPSPLASVRLFSASLQTPAYPPVYGTQQLRTRIVLYALPLFLSTQFQNFMCFIVSAILLWSSFSLTHLSTGFQLFILPVRLLAENTHECDVIISIRHTFSSGTVIIKRH